MARRKPRRTHTIYDYARGDGWILTSMGDIEATDRGNVFEVVLYYTDDQSIRTMDTTSVDTLLTQLLDVGAKLGSYEGSSPEANVEYSEQPRAVRMQRHATDLYDRLCDVRGMSPTIAVRAAETFGSRWSEKTDWHEWQERVPGVGEGRAGTFAAALE